MLKDAASSAKPTKYAQNKRHGIYEGTLSMMNLAPERCSAPKTANGMTKHKLLKATILSKPPARTISVFAAHSATRKNRMPALHIETTVREISKNVARMVVCMWMPGVSSRALSGLYLGRNLCFWFKNGDSGPDRAQIEHASLRQASTCTQPFSPHFLRS